MLPTEARLEAELKQPLTPELVIDQLEKRYLPRIEAFRKESDLSLPLERQVRRTLRHEQEYLPETDWDNIRQELAARMASLRGENSADSPTAS